MLGPFRTISLCFCLGGDIQRGLIRGPPMFGAKWEFLGRILNLLDLWYKHPDIRLRIVEVTFLRWLIRVLDLLSCNICLEFLSKELKAFPLFVDVLADVVIRCNVCGYVLLVVS